jgi:hypothetical protein
LFFAHDQRERQAAFELDAGGDERRQGFDGGGATGFHVSGAEAVQFAVDDAGAGAVVLDQRDGIHVADPQQLKRIGAEAHN